MPGRFQVYLAIPTPKIEFDKESLLILKIDFLANRVVDFRFGLVIRPAQKFG